MFRQLAYVFAALVGGSAFAGMLPQVARAAEGKTVAVADGALSFTAPEGWEVRQPKVNFIEAEFAAKAVGDDMAEMRVTVSGAGGGVQANLDRWIGQFERAGGGAATKEDAKLEETKIAGQTVHFIDMAGTYLDKPFPLAPKAVPRENYRLLGAIIVTEKKGSYFVKGYGPAATVAANEKAFREFVGSLKLK